MTSPRNVKLADWVPAFCCVCPYCVLILLATAPVFGASIGWPAFFGLVCLCGKTTHWVLMTPTTGNEGLTE